MISVVIPIYNSGRTLFRCLSSVLNQDFKDFEIIAVDNNSEDRSREIIKSFRDKRIRYIFEKNRGRGYARNAGIKAARGDIIAMIDSDCVAPRNWLRKITEPIIKGKEEIVMGNEIIIGKDYVSVQRQISKQNFRRKMLDGNYINYFDTKNCAFKKQTLKRVGFFDEDMNSKEDVELGFRLLAFDPKTGNMEDFDAGMRMLSKRIRFFYLEDCSVLHDHPLSIYGWVKMVIDKSYFLRKSFDKNNKIIYLLPKKSYQRLGWREFISFFYDAPCSLIFGKNKDEVFFEIIIGFFHRIGIIKYEVYKLLKWL